MIAKVAEIAQVLDEPPSGYIKNIIFLENVIQVTDMRILWRRNLVLITNCQQMAF